MLPAQTHRKEPTLEKPIFISTNERLEKDGSSVIYEQYNVLVLYSAREIMLILLIYPQLLN